MLIVDEVNEDIISVLKEIDVVMDWRIKNSVCFVIDLEGFFV